MAQVIIPVRTTAFMMNIKLLENRIEKSFASIYRKGLFVSYYVFLTGTYGLSVYSFQLYKVCIAALAIGLTAGKNNIITF